MNSELKWYIIQIYTTRQVLVKKRKTANMDELIYSFNKLVSFKLLHNLNPEMENTTKRTIQVIKMINWQIPDKSSFSVLNGARKTMLAIQNGMKAKQTKILRIYFDIFSHFSWFVRKFYNFFISQSRICKIGNQRVLIKHTKYLIVFSRESNPNRILELSSESSSVTC